MAGRTYVAGEAAVKLTPNSGGFHQTARRELAADKLSTGVSLVADAKGFRTDAREKLARGPRLTHKVQLVADTTGFRQAAQAKLDTARLTVKVQPKFDSATPELQKLKTHLESIKLTIKVKVEIDDNGYRQKLALLTRDTTQRVRVDIDRRDIDGLREALNGVGSTVNNTTNNITNMGRSGARALRPLLYGFLALAAVSLIPLVGQLTQALGVIALIPAMATSALASIAALAIGFSGIGKAFTAKAPKVTDTAGQQNRQAAALRGMAAAERGLANAQRQGLAAQKRLNDERKMAVRRLRDMNDELDSAVLNEEDARIAIIDAQNDLNQAYMDGDALGIRKGQNAVRQAEEGLDQIMKKNQDLRADVEAANKAGVEGDEQVIAAKEGILDANDAILSAQESMLAAQESLNESTKSGVDAVNELEEALANLSPSARLFVETVRGLSDEWKELRLQVQESLFSGLSGEVQSLADMYLPSLKEQLSGIATEINGGLKYALDSLMSDGARENIDKIMEMTRISIGPLIKGFTDLAAGIGNIATVGSEFLPGIADSFANSMARFKEWSGSEEGQNEIRNYIAESIRTFDKVWEFVKEFSRVMKGLFQTSDEAGETMLESLTSTMREFADWMNTAEGQARMGTFWEDVRKTITDIFNMIGAAIKLADKIASILGINDDKRTTENGEITATNKGGDRTKYGPGYQNEDDQDVDADGNRVYGRWGIFPGFKNPFQGNPMESGDESKLNLNSGGSIADKLDNWIRGNGWKTDGEVDGPPKVGVGQGGRGARDYGALAGQIEGQLKGPQDLSSWDRFKEKISGIKDTVLGENGLSGWLGTLGGVFSGLGDTIGGVGDSIGEKITDVKEWIGDLRTNAGEWLGNIGDFFGGLGSRVGTVLTDIIDSKFPWLNTALETMRGWWDSVTSGIGSTWATLKEKAAEPINWIIENIINGALKSAWNAVAKVIPGLKEWDGVDTIATATPSTSGGQRNSRSPGVPEFRTGGVAGVMPGYTPGRDPFTIGVSGGEAIMRPEFTRAVGPEWVDDMNVAARRGGMAAVQDRMANYAFGGVVDSSLWAAVSSAFPNATLNSAYRPGHSGYHGRGGAIDIGGPMQSVADWIFQKFPSSAQLIWGPGPLIAAGNTDQGYAQNYFRDDLAGHFDHVHWASDVPVTSDGQMVSDERGGLLSTISGAISSAANSARSLAASGLNKALSGIENSIPDFGGSMIGSIPKDFFGAMKTSMLSAISGSSGGGAGPDAPWLPSAGAEQWRQMMIDAYKNQGYDPSPAKIDAWVRQIDTESSGNPNIAQQITDVNGTGEAAGVGLGQMIPTTWQAYRDPALPDNRRDPWAMTNAMVRYGEQKYGDQLLNMIGQGHGYDQGGLANAMGLLPKLTVEPERVLSPAQTVAFEKLIPLLEFVLPNLKPQAHKDPIPVTIADTGTLNGQPLQGATVGPNGEYIPSPTGAGTRGLYSVGPQATGYEKPVAFSTTPAGKTAMSLAGTFGFGKQAAYLQSKEEPLMQLSGGIAGAMAAAAGGPQAFAAHAAQTSAAAMANIGKNFAEYAPEAAGGIAESALSAIAGPLIGTVNTGMSKNEVTTAIGDATNRAMRRTKFGRNRTR
ncbi:hypothetical protein CH305_20725 [Rhodococcus sp. 15-649-2-2]|uniref:hypothetical protein n=1 Tax=Rhodococcus sp. 15-649-2-2 TaxID=2023140 RepID=UPI000B9A28DD|nr:hypothetical protein [Rhodococcus sp. 15-649-2-2]OZE76204.1 hypothetical protein CH305_20725 [Rhodococcus sp. 15-649-2-2]